MSVKIGYLGIPKNVKRIYVGVDGKARRVKKIYASEQKAGIVYMDNSPMQVSAKFNLGNLNSTLCAVYKDETTGKYSVVGTFKDKFILSNFLLSANGSLEDTGRSVSLGDAANPFLFPTHLSPFGSRYASDSVFLFSGVYSGRVFVKRISPYAMAEFKTADSDSSSFSFSSGSTSIASGPQDISDLDIVNTWPTNTFLAVNAAGSSGFVSSYTSNASAGKAFSFPAYKIAQRSVRNCGNYTLTKKMIATEQTTSSVYILGVCEWIDQYDKFVKIDTCGRHLLLNGTDYIPDSLYVGPALRGNAVISSGANTYSAYISTICYNDNDDNRVCKLIVDGGASFSGGSLVFSVASAEQSSESSDGKWQVLGTDTDGHIYVLSTINKNVKILKFRTETEGITKIAEYDTGYTIDDNTVLQDVVPVNYSDDDNNSFVPSFVLTKNNEYNEIVVVDRNLII